jgi:hypothetical protein
MIPTAAALIIAVPSFFDHLVEATVLMATSRLL